MWHWLASGRLSVLLLRQLTSFGVVGICATLTHVGVAWVLIELAMLNGFVANACGAAAAFPVSYLGNAKVTFASGRGLLDGASRYVVVTLVSLVLSSVILALAQAYGLPTYAYVLLVVLVVPPTTFLLAKFWAFQRPQPQG